jgi:hypothetical protein
MKKWILRITIAFFALVLIALVAIYFSLNGLVRLGVERGATRATGQTTSLHAAAVSIFGGTLQLSGLDVDNPTGYSSAKLFAMKDCQASAQISSLLTNDVIIPSIAIDGLEVTIEQNGLKSNLTDVLNLSKSSTPAAGGSAAPTPPGRNIHVGVIELTNTLVHLNAVGQTLTLNLGPIEIDDPTNPDGRPTKIADIVAKILVNVAQQIANDPHIPEALRAGINAANALTGNITQLLKDNSKDLGEKAKDLSQNLSNMFKKK